MDQLIGRVAEKAILNKLKTTQEAELVVIYGRRRVGKTFLVRQAYERDLILEFSGIHRADLKLQLRNFAEALAKANHLLVPATPKGWFEAFNTLEVLLAPLLRKQKKVMFFDEFPWINTPKSGFLQAFEHFWNTWACKQKNLIVVICGSSASWMIQKVINNKGGLHNRVTKKIRLLPFSVAETAAYLRSRKIVLDQYQILQLYMAIGGIPHYLKEVEKGESATQVIDKLCFSKDGFLYNEFNNLYAALFNNAEQHIAVIKALTTKKSGLTRNEIISTCQIKSGGSISVIIDELTESGFIACQHTFGRNTKDSIYKLIDEFSIFYLYFMATKKVQGEGSWMRYAASTSYKSWSGVAFESVCLKHVQEIKKGLGIGSVYTDLSGWQYQGKKKEEGAQIDLVIDRPDNCINLCEIKFTTDQFEINKKYAQQLENKLKVFKAKTRTKKTCFITVISTYGLKNKDKYPGLVQSELTLDYLFA